MCYVLVVQFQGQSDIVYRAPKIIQIMYYPIFSERLSSAITKSHIKKKRIFIEKRL